jgi:hypothetical protein
MKIRYSNINVYNKILDIYVLCNCFFWGLGKNVTNSLCNGRKIMNELNEGCGNVGKAQRSFTHRA